MKILRFFLNNPVAGLALAGTFRTASKKENKNKIVVSIISDSPKEDLNILLSDLQQEHNHNDLHLALVGHAAPDSIALAGLNFKDISQVCTDRPEINHIHLLGCNVAKAKQPKKEKEMVIALKSKSKLQYGLLSILEGPSGNKEFQEKCCLFCKKNQLNGVYVINKKATGEFQLFSMKYDKVKNTIKEKINEIPAIRYEGINHILFNQKKPSLFLNKKVNFCPFDKKD